MGENNDNQRCCHRPFDRHIFFALEPAREVNGNLTGKEGGFIGSLLVTEKRLGYCRYGPEGAAAYFCFYNRVLGDWQEKKCRKHKKNSGLAGPAASEWAWNGEKLTKMSQYYKGNSAGGRPENVEMTLLSSPLGRIINIRAIRGRGRSG